MEASDVEDLRVPTRQIAVEIFFDTGEHHSGSMFVTRGPYETSPLDDILSILNDERWFVPFQLQRDERMIVLNKAHIERVCVADSASDPILGDSLQIDATEQSERCELVFTGGTHRAGKIALPTRQSESRVIDKLNHADRFFKLITDRGVDLVHAAHVVRVN